MKPDLLFVGGGLANGLAALRLSHERPEVRLRVLEARATMSGGQTWSFHDDDLNAAQRAWTAPLVSHRWPSYEVRFPRYRRVVARGYNTIHAAHFSAVVTNTLGDRVWTGFPVRDVSSGAVTAADGTTHTATTVIDGRGFQSTPALGLAYQKFVGQVVSFARPIGLSHPIIMDATVGQHDGFRFVYVLPFDDQTALVEDTYYSDTPDLDPTVLRARIGEYVDRQGWVASDVVREESGVLPVVLSGDVDALWDETPGVARTGLRAGLFHPTTGYSFPYAVRAADLLAASDLAPMSAYRALRRESTRAWAAGGFFRGLNRMLFMAARPEERYRVLERFYKLSESLIARFYAGRLTLRDRARILFGVPPVPVGAALRALAETRAGRPS